MLVMHLGCCASINNDKKNENSIPFFARITYSTKSCVCRLDKIGQLSLKFQNRCFMKEAYLDKFFEHNYHKIPK